MKLKKLEIIGFKSFLDKATISFPAGISAVVGPNGCGKSNIVDALRWVMGEQSVKQLRGKNREDIIFSGTYGQAPTNMAEVSVTLINDNGHAPEIYKDYSEIMVTRRLYRSGESAYLINKQPCRLKDIHNVFIGSGMGARTYSVIGQGNIGAITDAGPDERRVFIEEAAGVTRYKARKAETLSKIKMTNQNLLRVNDIVAEVKRQLDGLKRQAQRAERYKNYQQQIKYFDSRLLCHYHDEINGQIENSRKLLQQLQDTDLARSSEIKKLDAAVENIKLKQWEKNQEISSQKSHKFELQRNADRAETELSHFKTNLEQLKEEITALEDVREELEIKDQRIQTDIAQMEKKAEQRKVDLTAVQTQLEKESSDARVLQEEVTQQNRQMETRKNELMQMVAEEARLRNSLQTTANSKDGLKRRLHRIDEEAVLSNQKKDQLEKEVGASRKKMDQIAAEIEEYDRRMTVSKRRLDEKSRLLAEQVKITQTLEFDRNQARSKLSALKKMADNYDWYKDGVKAIMKAWEAYNNLTNQSKPTTPKESDFKDRHRFSAEVLGITADIIEAESDYQVAVTAVLGEALQYIIVKDRQDGQEAIQYLRSTQSGRGGFIPIAALAPFKATISDNIEPQKRLLNHVQIKPGFEKVAKTLLGHILVADDMDMALKLVSPNHPQVIVVTLSGEIVNPCGILVGGSQDKLSGILAKKQELKDIEQQVAALDRRLDKARSRQTELEESLRETEVALQKIAQLKAETVQIETETEKEIYRLTEDLKNAKRHLEIVLNEQEQLLEEESDLTTEFEKQNQLVSSIENQVQSVQANISAISGDITRLSEKLNQFNQATMDLRLKQTTLQADLGNSQNTLKRLKEFHDDGILRLEQLTREIASKGEKEKTIKQKSIENQDLLKTVYKQIETLDQSLRSNESDVEAIDAILKKNNDQIVKIQSKREETLKKIRLIELDLSEKKVKRENYQNRCEERYHVKIESLRKSICEHAEASDEAPMQVSQMEAELARYKARLASIGDVNMGAIEEFRLLKDRYDFLSKQRDDLVEAIDELHKVIRKINKITQERFVATFNAVNDKLTEVFPQLFDGGSAWLDLTDPNNLIESGVEYMVQPAGKKLTRMSLLSGGEKALSAIAFIFSIFLLKPASFCLMDEIDAPLDDANIFRFNHLLKIIGRNSQIVMITHNKRSMEFADMLFGITMEQKGISKVVSVNLQNN
jgi:chromosome segregation protein